MTGDTFNVWNTQADNPAAVPVCRILNTNGGRHLYSPIASECAAWKAETGAIEHYLRIIEACDGVDWATQDMVIEILRDEESHLRTFERYLLEYRS